MNRRRIIAAACLCAGLLGACSPASLAPAMPTLPAPMATGVDTPMPGPTLTPIPTTTPTQPPILPWMGTLYLDKNNSGEREPGEEGIAGLAVCVASDCSITDPQGRFEMPNSTGKTTASLQLTAPQTGSSADQRRFSQLAGTWVVPAYDKNGVVIPEQHLRKVTYSTLAPIVSGESRDFGLALPRNSNPCPVPLGKGWIFNYYTPRHPALDLAAANGTHLLSPGICRVTGIGADDAGGHVALLTCDDLRVRNLSFIHETFALHDYDTLKWYGIPVEALFNDDGTIKRSTFVKPSQHADVYPGQDLHLYVGCTGHCSQQPHVHINMYDPRNAYDPLKYLDCSK